MAPTLQRDVHTFLTEQSEIDTVTDLLTMRLGPGSALDITEAGRTGRRRARRLQRELDGAAGTDRPPPV